jgi:hypothetical protein
VRHAAPQWRVHGASEGRVRLLSPFDPVLWDRTRFEQFWSWLYRFEAYTRALLHCTANAAEFHGSSARLEVVTLELRGLEFNRRADTVVDRAQALVAILC